MDDAREMFEQNSAMDEVTKLAPLRIPSDPEEQQAALAAARTVDPNAEIRDGGRRGWFLFTDNKRAMMMAMLAIPKQVKQTFKLDD